MYTLVIGNKNYSSWSMRGGLAVAATGAPFEEELIQLQEADTKQRILARSPAGRVPILIDGPTQVWDSLAIIEFLAERHPDAGLWPKNGAARAHGRAIAAEMHSGFGPMRSTLPMNLRRKAKPHPRRMPRAVTADITRICQIWRGARGDFGAGGPFLFGAWGAADVMFAPVVSRFATYAVTTGPVETAYRQAVEAHPDYVAWRKAALAETWIVPADEVD